MNHRQIERRVILTCVGFAGIVATGYFLVAGWKPLFLVGIACGTVVMLLNFHLLLTGAGRFFAKGDYGAAGGVYLLRLALYGLAGLACYKAGMLCLSAYAVGVSGLLVGVLVAFGKGGNADD